MTAHPEDYVRGIARVLQGESTKARCYVDHSLSLGVLREKMVASLIRDETPTRYRVDTGLIRDYESPHPINSKQIDLLVHDPTDHAPLYKWGDFVVVKWHAAKAVVEVKSVLDQIRFNELLELHQSVRNINRGCYGSIPTFGYALTGVAFETFVNYLAQSIRENRIATSEIYSTADSYQNLPTCIAVQSANYIAITPSVPTGDWYCCAVNYAGTGDADGFETGVFIELYSRLIEPHRTAFLESREVSNWFNLQNVPTKCYISQDGTIAYGPIPTRH